jgi:predicted negative regulator of RcsB-dependent stress response
VRTEVRHRLKEDPFAEGTREIWEWLLDHRNNIVGGIVVAAIIIAGYLAWWYHSQNREQQGSLELAQAVRTMNAPLGAAAMPGQESYANAQARAQAAQKKLESIARNYSSTTSGRMAAYYLGIEDLNSGDSAAAEKQLKQVAGFSDKGIASLAKLALASLYVSTGKPDQAVPLCDDLIAHPTGTVSKSEAQLQLAQAYQAKQPEEAIKIYRQLQVDDPSSPVASIAMNRMAEMKK